jgi:uncharacterized membrane protein YraQ (UPF0718 family)
MSKWDFIALLPAIVVASIAFTHFTKEPWYFVLFYLMLGVLFGALLSMWFDFIAKKKLEEEKKAKT